MVPAGVARAGFLSSDTGTTVPAVILSDATIRSEVAAGRIVIDPYDDAMVQPSSIDVRLDDRFLVFRSHTRAVIDVKEDLTDLTEMVRAAEGEPFILHPGEFVLGSTAERVSLPDDIVGRIEGKSSLGRLGLIASIEEMQDMVEATLTFARGLTGSEPAEPVEIGAFLASLRDDMVGGFDLTDGPRLTTRLKPNALRRALRNLIENAQRYGGTARVSWHEDRGELSIIVDDDGPGIPEAELERVFDPFYRLETSRSLETGGHGLGLSIARTIARAHGGDIHLENREGRGLRATLAIPLAPDPADPKGD